MPFLPRDGGRLYFRIDGRLDRPLLVLSNSLGTDLFMWSEQVQPLTQHFSVLRYDTRGHGATDSYPGDYNVELLARDVLALADHVGSRRFAFCGLSLGALIGQWLGIHAPERLTHLVLSNASAHLPPADAWTARMTAARTGGMQALVDLVIERFFSEQFRRRDEPLFHTFRTTFLGTDPSGYAACCAAVRDADFRELLSSIRTPTLVIVGNQDAATPPALHGELLAKAIPGARLARLDAGHIANAERPAEFTAQLLEFLRL
jgi:3-oxoadipate enol-lactonase